MDYKNCFFSILVLSLCYASDISAQDTENVWSTLALMKMERENANVISTESRIIPLIEALDGREIIVKGYIIPLSGKKAQSHFMFSAYPYANCYFCGNAGPESVMETFAKDGDEIKYSENAITLKGVFKFTSRDPNDIMFTLENAEKVN